MSLSIERAIFAFAGLMVLVSVGLAYFVHPAWLGLTAFVGLNLLQSAFTRFCPAAIVLRRLGLQSGKAFS